MPHCIVKPIGVAAILAAGLGLMACAGGTTTAHEPAPQVTTAETAAPATTEAPPTANEAPTTEWPTTQRPTTTTDAPDPTPAPSMPPTTQAPTTTVDPRAAAAAYYMQIVTPYNCGLGIVSLVEADVSSDCCTTPTSGPPSKNRRFPCSEVSPTRRWRSSKDSSVTRDPPMSKVTLTPSWRTVR